jgi:hypothetical protein
MNNIKYVDTWLPIEELRLNHTYISSFMGYIYTVINKKGTVDLYLLNLKSNIFSHYSEIGKDVRFKEVQHELTITE